MNRQKRPAPLSLLRAAVRKLCAGLLACAFLPFSGTAAAFDLPNSATVSVPELEYRCPESQREDVFASRNVLVIVPHEDDEVCLIGGIIDQYLACGSTVRVLFVTNGDYGDLGETRLQEAIDALAECGLPEENILFLGYGDQWQGRHIYHSPDRQTKQSFIGREQTYGLPKHPAYRIHSYTRAHLVSDLSSAILEFLPDTIFCIDLDGHRDHRATSLFFDECMASILKKTPDYAPNVYKGFGYTTAWYAVDDFYSENIRATRDPGKGSVIAEQPAYAWADRVRFPVSVASLSRLKTDSLVYRMLLHHATQSAAERAGRIISGDRVYWYRPTTSVLYRASVSVSSGKASYLTDFKLTDIEDVNRKEATFANCVWSPDANDLRREVTVSFSAPQTLSELRLYDAPSLYSNVLNASIVFSDGSTVETGALRQSGAPTVVAFPEKQGITGFTLRITASEGDDAGLCELEAYAAPPHDGKPAYIKLMNADGDFCYDYWITSTGTETLYLYGADDTGSDLADRYTLTVSGPAGCAATFDGDGIAVTCPLGAELILTVESVDDPSLSDTVRISNPTSARRWLVALYQKEEKQRIASK